MSRNVIFTFLFTTTLFVSAALLFLVQPLVARLVLPLLGGTPAVWNTCMVFFQAVLLAGYGYAHLAPKWLGRRRQPLFHLLLLPLPLLVLPIALPGDVMPSETLPVLWLLGLLVVLAGLPFFVVSTSAPLLQRWFSEAGHPASSDPYFLYAASNLGSILALAAYPAVVEPLLPLAEQGRWWTAGYALLAVLIGCCAIALWRSPVATRSDGLTEKTPPPTWTRRSHWLLLAVVPSSLMLSVTMYITTDVAAIPLLWVVPLSLYLLTFVIAFARRPWLPHRVVVRWTPMVILVICLLLLLFERTEPVWLIVALHLLGLFWIALMCHGELARTRPESRDLTEFYLWLSLGGVLGGLFNAFAAPLLFNGIVEYPLVLVLACALRPILQHPVVAPVVARSSGACETVEESGKPSVGDSGTVGRPCHNGGPSRFNWRDLLFPLGVGVLTAALVFAFQKYGLDLARLTPSTQAAVKKYELDLSRLNAAVMFGPALVFCYMMQTRPLRHALAIGALLLASGFYNGVYGEPLYRTRSFFGVHRVTLDPTGQYRILVHGNTIHGMQSVDPARRDEPLTYYHRSGPVGQIFAALHGDERLQRIGVVGMGTATLCAYAEPGQRWTYFEIDPAVVAIARDDRLFTYFSDSAARCGQEPAVVLGDARLMLAHTGEKYGLLVIDAFSSDAIPLHLLTSEALAVYRRHLDDNGVLLFNISNRYLDLEVVLANLAADAGMASISQADLLGDKTTGRTASHWVALAATPEALAKVRRKGIWGTLVAKPGGRVWRDDHSNIISVIKWRSDE